MRKRDYDAFVISQKLKGIELPTFEELVIDSMPVEVSIKREEIIHNVGVRLPGNIDVEGLGQDISSTLDKLEKSGIVSNTSQGYWMRLK